MKRVTRILLTLTVFCLVVAMTPTSFAASDSRTTVPETNNSYYYNSSYNPFYTRNLWTWCTWYAYGRAYEILGSKPDLSLNAAKYWFYDNQNKVAAGGGYSYSTDYYSAKVGAVACYTNHVQIVESVKQDGSPATISTGGWHPTQRNPGIEFKQENNWKLWTNFYYGQDWSYDTGFLGYIYITDAVTKLPPPSSPTVNTLQAIAEDDGGYTLYGSAKSTGGKITSCGMYLGTSESNMTKLGSDPINTYSTSMWYSTSKYGRTLEGGTTYYYRAYAVAGGVTYYGNTCTFTTPSDNKASISLNKSSLTVTDNVCVQLTATTTPKGQAVSWTSSNQAVATVSSSGEVAALEAGTATITASMVYGGTTYTASCEVTVTSSGQDGISLNHSSVSIKDGETVQLSATTIPSGQAVTYSSSDTSVVVVSQTSGKMIGVNKGVATVTASMTYNGTTYTAECIVTVTPSVDEAGIILNKTSITIANNASLRLIATTVPNNRSITWSSSNTSVATVIDGKVTAVSAGTATIAASMVYNGSSYYAYCAVTVETGAENALTAPKLTLSSYTITEGESFTASWTSAGANAKYYISYSGQLNDGSISVGNWNDTQSLSDSSGSHGESWKAGTYKIYVVAYNELGSVYSNEVTLTIKAPNNASIAWDVDYSRFNIGSTNATIAVIGTVNGTSTANISKVGIYLYDASGNYLTGKSEFVSFSDSYNYFYVWYDVNNSLGYTMSKGTTYKAQFYAVIDGTTYSSQMFRFTTSN